MDKRLKIVTFLILISFLVGGVSQAAPSIKDFLIYNYQTGLAYFSNNVPQWLFGGTTTSTPATVEIQGANPLALTSITSECLETDADGNVIGSGSACGSGGGGGSGYQPWTTNGSSQLTATSTDILAAGSITATTFGQFNNVSTTDTIYAGGNITSDGYASTTAGLFTQGNAHIGGSMSIDDFIRLTPQATVAHQEGIIYYDSDDDTFVAYNAESDTGLNIGEEMWIFSRNSTGETIMDGEAVYISGATGNRPNISLAVASSTDIGELVGIATHPIENNTDGYVTVFGIVRDIDTSAFSAGDTLWLDPVTRGAITNVMPSAPNFPIQIGRVLTSNAVTGRILVNTGPTDVLGNMVIQELDINSDLRVGGNSTTTGEVIVGDRNVGDNFDFYNGTFDWNFDALVQSDGVTASTTLERTGGGDLLMRFSDSYTTLDCSPTKCVIELTAGTDATPQANWIYIPQSSKVLTKSTTAWPTTEHIRVGYFLCPSVATIQTNGGCYVNNNINDGNGNGSSNKGHLVDIASRSRLDGAYYFNGVDGAGTTDYLTITAGNVELKSGSGIVYQMHMHTFPAFDTSVGDEVLVKNWSGDSYHNITNLHDIVADSTGTTLANRWFNIVVWGAANKTDDSFEPVMINLPSCSYTNQASAEQDISGCDDFTIPREFSIDSATGFLISRITVRQGATWTYGSLVDLRGIKPSTASGGASASVTNFLDSTWTIEDTDDTTRIGVFDLGEVLTGNTRTITWPDYNFNFNSPNFPNGTTTDSWFVGGYASSTLGFFTQGDLHIGGNATIDGTLDVLGDITGSNLSGTNTGDQDLSGFMLNTGDTATGDYNFDSDTFAIDSTNNRVGIGIATPTTTLQVSGNADTVLSFADQDTSVADNQSIGDLTWYSADTSSTLQDKERAKISVYADPDNGFGAGHNMGFFTRSTGDYLERMTIDGDGNVGIGTASPSQELHINSGASRILLEGTLPTLILQDTDITDDNIWIDGNGGALRILGADDALASFTNMYLLENANHRLFVDNSEMVRVDSTGVGIDTASPELKLHIGPDAPTGTYLDSANNNGLLVAPDVNRGMVAIEGNTEAHLTLMDQGGTANQRIFNIHSIDEMGYISSYNDSFGLRQTFAQFDMTSTAGDLSLQPAGGMVGIGTTSAGADLHVENDSNTEIRLVETGIAGDGNTINVINFYGGDSADNETNYASMRITADSDNNTDERGRIDLRTMDGGTLASRLSIDGVNVGIGTETPAAMLDVAGDAIINGSATTTDNLVVGSDIGSTKKGCMKIMSSTAVFTYVYYNGLTRVETASSCEDTGSNTTSTVQIGI